MMLLLYLAVLIIPVRPEYSLGFGRDRYESCEKKTAKCMRISNVTFMGTPLPYNSTTLDLIPVDDQVMIMVNYDFILIFKFLVQFTVCFCMTYFFQLC